MAHASALLRRARRKLAQLSDETTRFTDVLCQFREVVRDPGGGTLPTGRVSSVYGWRYDTWRRNPGGTLGGWADLDELPDPRIEVYDASPVQFDVLTDDETPHFLVFGSRGSGKTHLVELWHVKQICKWAGHSISFMREKRQKCREYMEKRLLRRIPGEWVPDKKRDIRRAADELSIRVVNDVSCLFVTSFKVDDARGTDVVAAIIDETQLTPPEARENLLLSVRRAGQTDGKVLQTLETGTYVESVMDYVERCRKDERYRCVELSITDNMHLETVRDTVTGAELPPMVISARSAMDLRRFEQEIGRWDAEAQRFRPMVAIGIGRVYWPFKRDVHVVAHGGAMANERVIRRLFDSAHPDVGRDKTAEMATLRGFPRGTVWLAGAELEAPPLASVSARVLRAPPGIPDVLWVVGEVGVEEDGTRLAQAMVERGWANVGLVPDAAGRYSAGGKSTTRELRNELGAERVKGPAKNPKDIDRVNAVNAKLQNANNQVTLLIDPSCTNLIAALAKQERTSSQKREAEMQGFEHRYARALGYLVDYFWPVRMLDLAVNA